MDKLSPTLTNIAVEKKNRNFYNLLNNKIVTQMVSQIGERWSCNTNSFSRSYKTFFMDQHLA